MFKCRKCGLCCKSLKNNPLYKDLDRGDGVCKYLAGNLCTIYDNRPLLCRVDESYEQFFKDDYTKEEYYNMNYEVCKMLQTNKI